MQPIRHKCERLRSPATDIGSLVRGGSLSGEPQDCSNDSTAGQCALLMHHLLPSRLRLDTAQGAAPGETTAALDHPPYVLALITATPQAPFTTLRSKTISTVMDLVERQHNAIC